MLEVERGEGIYLFDKAGKRYIDLISGIAVSNVGHAAPEVVAAIKRQAEVYIHSMVYGEHIQEVQVLFAQKLTELLPDSLSVVYFLNSGGEAVEGALKVSKRFTGRKKLLSCHRSYHGSTHGALSVTGMSWLKEGYGPLLPEVEFIEYNHWPSIEKITEEHAAFIIEPIQAASGIRLPDSGYLAAIRKRCDETGTLLIFDEIQSGFGRTGKFCALHHEGVTPDILLLAKSLGGGMPLGAFITRPEIIRIIQQDPVLGHITTFGGHPVCCAAGMAALDKILNEGLMEAIPAKEALVRRILKHPAIKAIRGRGLMLGLELESYEQVLEVWKVAHEKGLLLIWHLDAGEVIRIAPPLTITEAELTTALATLLEAIDEVYQPTNA